MYAKTVWVDGGAPGITAIHLNNLETQHDESVVDLAAHVGDYTSETVTGHVELATAAETTAGTDDTRAVHPVGLKVELDKKVNLAGDTMTGELVAMATQTIATKQVRNIILSTLDADAGVGSNGDIWIKYTA